MEEPKEWLQLEEEGGSDWMLLDIAYNPFPFSFSQLFWHEIVDLLLNHSACVFLFPEIFTKLTSFSIPPTLFLIPSFLSCDILLFYLLLSTLIYLESNLTSSHQLHPIQPITTSKSTARPSTSAPILSQHTSHSQPFALRPSAKNKQDEEKDQDEKDAAFQAQLGVKLHCPDCGPSDSPNIIEEFSSGDLVCGNCGLVLGDRIVDTRSEWRTFANEDGDDPSRVGSAQNPLLGGLQTHSFETRISSKDGYTGVAIALQRAASRVAAPQGRALQDAFNLIQSKGESISLERMVTDSAKQLYARVLKEGILKNKRLEAIVAATIFVACRAHKVPRTFPEIVALTNVPKKEVGKCFKEIAKNFNINTAVMNGGKEGESSGAGITPTDAIDLIGRFSNHLGIKVNGFAKSSEMLAQSVRELGFLAGRSPVTIAACILLMCCTLWDGEAKRTAKDIARVASVSEVTIKSSYRKLVVEQKEHGKLISPEFLEKYKGRIDVKRLVE